jgi:exopolyphosphatase / guanosine-5'-triphosphate,3'-diphosphate pyrophosphatase
VRVAVVDIGTNSTRLLIAEPDGDGGLRELERRTEVTRLGEGVDRSGRLGEAPQARVLAVLARYVEAIQAHAVERTTTVMTSAVRDAANGPEFVARIRRERGLEGRTLSGDEEAELTFRGATAGRRDYGRLLVIDIGGGSTELVVGAGGAVGFHVSTQNGVVRHTERHLHSDPPAPAEMDALSAAVRADFARRAPADVRSEADAAVAVAGTPTSCAAIDLELEPYDPARVEGHQLSLARLEELRDGLAAVPLAQRRRVIGLHPDRAPTIVAGVLILIEALRAFGLERVAVSEHDILWGAALPAQTGGDVKGATLK